MPKTTYEMRKDEARLIGQRTKWARELRDMTATDLASHIGVDSTVIRVIERGARLPSLHVMMAICHILSVSPQYLLWGSLVEVDPELAARLKREHPELQWPAARPVPDNHSTISRNNAQPARKWGRPRHALQGA